MRRALRHTGSGQGLSRGFSLIELVIALALILIVTAVAVPSLMRVAKNYQLSASASQLSGILKFSRSEAIRRNTLVSCQIQQMGTDWILWVDSNGNGVADAAETQVLVGGNTTLLPGASAPNPTALTGALGVSSLTVLSGSNGSVRFDPRGAVNFGAGVPTVYVLYIGNPSEPDYGYLAVIVLPSGVTQLWGSSSSGDWHQIN